jgi:hypothetical protein
MTTSNLLAASTLYGNITARSTFFVLSMLDRFIEQGLGPRATYAASQAQKDEFGATKEPDSHDTGTRYMSYHLLSTGSKHGIQIHPGQTMHSTPF